MSAPAIVLEGVSLRYGRTTALDGLTASLPADTVTGLVGRNGAGKTSLLRVVAGRELRHSGRATVGGLDIRRLDAGVVHLAAESWPLAADLPLSTLTARLRGVHPAFDAGRAVELLERFRVPPGRPLSRLSRGQASAAAVCLALASRAPVTLLDEPHLGLDAPSRDLFRTVVIEEIGALPRTLVVSTHLIDESAPLFERVLVLDAGRLVAHGDVDALLGRYARVSGDAAAVAALPRLGELRRLGGRATAIVARADAAGLRPEPLTLQELAGALTLGPTPPQGDPS